MLDFTAYQTTVKYPSRKDFPDVLDYKKAREAYYDNVSDCHNRFRQDLFEDLDIVDNSKRDLLFSKAWELGHSSGYNEVYNYACDLVELIK